MDSIVKNKPEDTTQSYNPYHQALTYGLVTGIVVLYMGLVGMLASFIEEELIREFMTLAQLFLVVPPFVGAFLAASKNNDNKKGIIENVLSGIIVGALTAIPTLILLFLNEYVIPDMREILINVNRDWVEVITFDNRDNLILGSMMLMGLLTGMGLLGGILASLPQKVYRALILGTSITILVAVFGDPLGLILQQLLPDDAIDAIFRRSVLKQEPALILLVISLIGSFIWSFGSETIQDQYQALPEQPRRLSQWTGFALFGLILLFLPLIIGQALSNTAVTIGLYVLMGLGLNIAIGLAGLLDLGYVTNFAVGAYLMAALTSVGPLGLSDNFANWLNSWGWLPFTVPATIINFWVVLPIAVLAAMLTGFIFAVPVLKMRGDYLAIATLGFGEIVRVLVNSDWFAPVIGGAQGISFVPKPVFFGTELAHPQQIYYIVFVACIITLFISIRLNNSRTGRQWMAIREDEDVAMAMGINVARAKLLAFTLSAATGGLAGAIFAANVASVFPNSFNVFVSINVLSLIIVGGIGSNPGIFVGALVLIGMPELLREFSDFRFLIYGVLLVFMMVNRPEGLWPSTVRQREINTAKETQLTTETTVMTP